MLLARLLHRLLMQDFDPTRFDEFCSVAGCPKLPRAYRVGFCTLASCVGVASEKKLLAAVAVSLGCRRSSTKVVSLQRVRDFIRLWLRSGFSGTCVALPFIQHTMDVCMAWLFCPGNRASRKSSVVWQVVFWCSCALALEQLHSESAVDGRLRVLTRCWHPSLALAFHTGDWQNRVWHLYVDACLASAESGHGSRGSSSLYAAWTSTSRLWYVGKAVHVRRSCSVSGSLARFMEHVFGSFRYQPTAWRYHCWRSSRPPRFRFLPMHLSDTDDIFALEARAQSLLSPPAQEYPTARISTRPARKPRPWPRFRNRSLDLRAEARHNIHVDAGTFVERDLRAVDPATWCRRMREHNGASAADLLRGCYTLGREHWICALWSAPWFHFRWKRVWKRPEPCVFVCRIWCAASSLPWKARQAIRRNCERFGATAGWWPHRRCHVVIPSNCPRAVRTVRRWIAQAARSTIGDGHVRHVLLARIHLHIGRGPNVADSSNHRASARHFSLGGYTSLQHLEAAAAGEDLERLPQHWDAHRCESPADLAWTVLSRVLESRACDPACRAKLCDTVEDLVCQLGCSPKFRPIASTDVFPVPAANETLVPIDRDIKRRVLVATQGYHDRMVRNFLYDPSTYRVRADWTIGDVLLFHERCLVEHVPFRFRQRDGVRDDQIPFPYILPKRKCLGARYGMACSKDHAHIREIVSSYHHPAKQFLRCAARCLRILQRSSGMASWTIWNSSRLRDTLFERVNKLARVDQFWSRCPCGCTKPWPVSLAKFDAAQFF